MQSVNNSCGQVHASILMGRAGDSGFSTQVYILNLHTVPAIILVTQNTHIKKKESLFF